MEAIKQIKVSFLDLDHNVIAKETFHHVLDRNDLFKRVMARKECLGSFDERFWLSGVCRLDLYNEFYNYIEYTNCH